LGKFSERAIDDRIDVCGFILNFFLYKEIKGYFDQEAFSLNHQSRFSKSSGVSIPIPTCVVSTILFVSQIPGNAVVPVFRCFQ
jgi:hypothetical protein